MKPEQLKNFLRNIRGKKFTDSQCDWVASYCRMPIVKASGSAGRGGVNLIFEDRSACIAFRDALFEDCSDCIDEIHPFDDLNLLSSKQRCTCILPWIFELKTKGTLSNYVLKCLENLSQPEIKQLKSAPTSSLEAATSSLEDLRTSSLPVLVNLVFSHLPLCSDLEKEKNGNYQKCLTFAATDQYGRVITPLRLDPRKLQAKKVDS